MNDDQFVKAMAAPDHYRELRRYLLKAREQGARFDDDLDVSAMPDSLEDRYPAQASKAWRDPPAYRELARFLHGKRTFSCGDRTVHYVMIWRFVHG